MAVFFIRFLILAFSVNAAAMKISKRIMSHNLVGHFPLSLSPIGAPDYKL